MTEAEQNLVVAIVDNELGNIEVDERGRCKWTDVANALTHIQAQLRHHVAVNIHNRETP